MANEITYRCSLQIRKGNLNYQSQPQGFQRNMVGTSRGGTPGLIEASPAGTKVDLSLLTLPGAYTIQNLDTINTVHFGVYDPVTKVFYPLNEIGPGEIYPGRFSKFLSETLGTGSGTGDTTADECYTMVKAENAECDVIVNAFEA